jgi:hypothetical protein
MEHLDYTSIEMFINVCVVSVILGSILCVRIVEIYFDL